MVSTAYLVFGVVHAPMDATQKIYIVSRNGVLFLYFTVSAMTEKTKEGVVLSVQESRLTGFFTHVLVLASLMALSTIKLIPLPVLYGVFLFMGLVALPAQQFWQRFLLFFMQVRAKTILYY